jgi:hypothetical protein
MEMSQQSAPSIALKSITGAECHGYCMEVHTKTKRSKSEQMKTIAQKRTEHPTRVRPRQRGHRVMRCNVECPGWDTMIKAISNYNGRASLASLDAAYAMRHDARKEADLDKSCTGEFAGHKRLGSDGWPVASSKEGRWYGRVYLSRKPGTLFYFDPERGYRVLNDFTIPRFVLWPRKCPLLSFDIPLQKSLTTGDVSVLSMDTIAEIASYLDPMSLVQLTQTCRLMRTTVNESQTCITRVLLRCNYIAHLTVIRLVPRAPGTVWTQLQGKNTNYGYPVHALIRVLETASASWYTQFR